MRIYVTRFRASAFGDVTGNVNVFTLLLTGRADIRGNISIYRIATLVAFPYRHVSLPLLENECSQPLTYYYQRSLLLCMHR